jgi:hypothetical protein
MVRRARSSCAPNTILYGNLGKTFFCPIFRKILVFIVLFNTCNISSLTLSNHLWDYCLKTRNISVFIQFLYYFQ